MQLNRARLWSAQGSALALLLLGSPARAQGVSDQAAAYAFHFFADADDVHVFSNYGSYDLNLANGGQVNLRLNHETVVIPAVDAPVGSQEAVDAITTASRPLRTPGQVFESYTKRRDEVTASAAKHGARLGYYMSSESDYFAQQVSGSYNRDFFEQSFNFAVALSYGWDDIQPLEDADTDGTPGYRRTTHVSAVATQILSRTTTLRVGAEMSAVDGLQHSPYRNVYVAGTNVSERHPNSRSRRDVFLRLNQYLMNRSSLKLHYKYYLDDWGIGSHTAGSMLTQYITDFVTVRYRYRYYHQSAADFYREEYLQPGGINGFQTGDYRMGEFTAHLFGTKLEWGLGNLFPDSDVFGRMRLSLSYERYFNSNNFSANIFETGLSAVF